MSKDIKQLIVELNQQSEKLYQQRRYAEAIQFVSQAYDMASQHLGEDHPYLGQSLTNLAELHTSMGNYTQAEPLYKKAIMIFRKALGKDHRLYVVSLSGLASLYYSMGNYAQAEPLFKEAMEIRRKSLGTDHPDYAKSLTNLAVLYKTMGNYAQAEPLYKEVIMIFRKALGEDHPDYAASLNNLAVLYETMGNYAQAEPLYKEVIMIFRKALGEDHPSFGTSLHNLAGLYKSMGDYAQAESLFKEAMEIRRKSFGEDHQNYAASLNDVALLYHSMGDYAQAEPLLKKAMKIYRKTLGADHPDFSICLNSLAELYRSMGDYAQAVSLYKEAMEIRRKVLGEYHPSIATILNNLGSLYETMGNYAQAEPLLKEATKIYCKTLGADHPDFSTSLHNLAGLYMSMGDYAQAEPLFKEAMKIYRKALGKDHQSFAGSLNGLALLYHSMGDYAQAEPLYKEAMKIYRKGLGKDHPNYTTSLNNLAGLYIATDRETEALPLMEQAASIDDLMIGQVFSIGSESQRMEYLRSVQANFAAFISLVSQHLSSSSAAINSAFELVLRRKAVSAEVLAAQRDAVLSGRYPELEEKLRELTGLRMQIAQKALAGPGLEGLGEHQSTLSIWNKQKENLEAELVSQLPEMNLEQRLKAVDRNAIASALPQGAVLIEFVRFNVFDFKAVPARGELHRKPARYLAFVMPTGELDNVQMIDLGEAKFIDKRIARFRSSVTGEFEGVTSDRTATEAESADDSLIDVSSKTTGFWSRLFRHFKKQEHEEIKRDLGVLPGELDQEAGNGVGIRLREAVFDRLVPALGKCKHLLISPDGELSRIPFEVLPDTTGRFLIDDYHISYLGAGRDILRFGAESTGESAGSLVIADPDFDLGLKGSRRLLQKGDLHGRQSRDLDRSDLHFGRLVGTRVEGKSIGNMLGVKPWFEGKALEAQLKAYRSPRILHFATHGFFLKDQKRDPNKEMRDLGHLGFVDSGSIGRLSGPGLENPLLRSGLALAGVNTWAKGGNPPPEAEDGLLTAEDVTGLDLLDTELVVLSACETGLGEVRTGEGVFGLRRSFVLAGAKTLVMSLWKVPDKQTQELMDEFYRRILAGEPRAEALRNAQKSIRSKHPKPRDWGAFICQGDPSPLRVNPLVVERPRKATKQFDQHRFEVERIDKRKQQPQRQKRPLQQSHGDEVARLCRFPGATREIGPNAPCPCGSGKKYKKCCGAHIFKGTAEESIPHPTAHPATDPKRAFPLNIRYQKQLEEWKAVPW